MNLSKKHIFFALFALLTTTLSAQNQEEDSISLHHPEKRYWFPNTKPNLLYNRAISLQSQVIWATAYHTAAPVPIGSVGPEKYTSQLSGIIQNTDIAKVMKQAVNDRINVILVIGDGMGNMHMSLPIYMRIAQQESKPTMFEKIMKEGRSGYVLTHPANGLVTCSAAAGTAIATGTKTRLEMVGVDTLGNAKESVLDEAVRKGMKTALVTDANITDATPAAFYGHVIIRDWQPELARQLAEDYSIDVLLGGGACNFIPGGTMFGDFSQFKDCNFQNNRSARKDSINPLETFARKGYRFACNAQQLNSMKSNEKVLGLFSANGLPAPIDRNDENQEVPTVKAMASKALDMVSSSKKGYFAMIECARIDWESHANDIGAVYEAVVEMNSVLEKAYAIYKKKPKKTLVIFTADHETGGLEIAYRKVKDHEADSFDCHDGQEWTSHTKSLSFDKFLKLAQHKKSLAKIISASQNSEELKQNVKNFTPYHISDYVAQKVFDAVLDTRSVPKHKK